MSVINRVVTITGAMLGRMRSDHIHCLRCGAVYYLGEEVFSHRRITTPAKYYCKPCARAVKLL